MMTETIAESLLDRYGATLRDERGKMVEGLVLLGEIDRNNFFIY